MLIVGSNTGTARSSRDGKGLTSPSKFLKLGGLGGGIIAIVMATGVRAEPVPAALGSRIQTAPAQNVSPAPVNPYPYPNRPLVRPRLKVHCSIQCGDEAPSEPVVIGETRDSKVVVIPK